MALEAWELAQKQTGNLVGAEIARVLRQQFGDIPLPTEVKSVHLRVETPRNPLQAVVQEYKTNPTTPEVVTRFWQTFIQASVEQADLKRDLQSVPECDRTQEELEAIRLEGKGMVYNPGFSYPVLDKIFPKMQSYAVKENSPVRDEYERAGWVDVETSLDAPNRNSEEGSLRDLFTSKGREGQRLSTYIWAAQASKVLTDHYFDEDTYSRLLGSRHGGDVVHAFFHPYGLLCVGWHLSPEFHSPRIGGRSEGVKA